MSNLLAQTEIFMTYAEGLNVEEEFLLRLDSAETIEHAALKSLRQPTPMKPSQFLTPVPIFTLTDI